MEIWKDIEGFEGKYQISNLGRVKSLNYNNTDKEKILKTFKGSHGNLIIGLHKNNQRQHKKIGKLVIEAFTNKKREVNKETIMYKDNDVLHIKKGLCLVSLWHL